MGIICERAYILKVLYLVNNCVDKMPVYHCAAVGCTNNTKKFGQEEKYKSMCGVTFHSFPHKLRQPRRRQEWLAQIKRKDLQPNKYSRVCSRHFVGGDGPTQDNPVPTLFQYNNYKDSLFMDILSPSAKPQPAPVDVAIADATKRPLVSVLRSHDSVGSALCVGADVEVGVKESTMFAGKQPGLPSDCVHLHTEVWDWVINTSAR